MKINVTGEHDFYKKGIHDVAEGRAEYLVKIGIAVYVPLWFDEKIIEQKTEKKIIDLKTEKKIINPDTDKKKIPVKKTRKKRTKK